ncbi:ribonuclease 2-5A-domain-containing protein [Mycena olivaceomarginata]|nr:ribonuclease 2-5A-domain-containing protein [Mycena olivaceomarginata]
MSKPTEVFIGKSVVLDHGPNNQDNILQGAYRNTKDDAYIQNLPNSEIISFKAREESSGTEDHSILWGLKFNNPIVAIFDVLRKPTYHNTFVLLQPRPQLSAILPKLTHATSMDQLPHLQSAYIGLVEETGSLFAMSPDRFPLVVFSGGGGARKNRVIKVIDEGPRELPSDVDAVTEERKGREKAMKERNYGSEDARCLDRSSLYIDRRCLVGIRPLEGGDGDGPENRLKRLIDGAPTVGLQAVMHWDPRENANTNTNTVPNGNGTPDGVGDEPGSGPALPGNSTLIEGREPAADDLSFWPSIVFAFVVGALGLWFGFGLGKLTRIPKEPYLLVLERGASGIVGNDWLSRLDPLFLENLGKFRKYDGWSVQDLLRALRNKKHHYQDLARQSQAESRAYARRFLGVFHAPVSSAVLTCALGRRGHLAAHRVDVQVLYTTADAPTLPLTPSSKPADLAHAPTCILTCYLLSEYQTLGNQLSCSLRPPGPVFVGCSLFETRMALAAAPWAAVLLSFRDHGQYVPLGGIAGVFLPDGLPGGFHR